MTDPAAQAHPAAQPGPVAQPHPATPPGPVTQPGPASGPRRRGRVRSASNAVSSVLALRIWLAAAGAVVAGAVAVWLYLQSMSVSVWGPYLPDGKPVEITRYSTGFLVGAAGALLVAGLLLTAAIADAVRRSRLRRATGPGPRSPESAGGGGWAPESTSSTATLAP